MGSVLIAMVATGNDGGGGACGAAGLDEQLYINSIIRPKRIAITTLNDLTLLDKCESDRFSIVLYLYVILNLCYFEIVKQFNNVV